MQGSAVPLVESADRVLRLLECFSPHDRSVSLGEIAERVGLPKSSVHRLLGTLIAHSLVERDEGTRRYRLGIRLFELGSAVIHERGLHNMAQPVMERLAASTGETCHLAVLSEGEAVYVVKVDWPSSILMSSQVGGRAPCHATSIGKVLLAWAREDVQRIIRQRPLRAHTPNTITTIEALDAELATVRERGYALDLEEFEEGLRCIAAPVRDQSRKVVSALGIAGPRRRLEDDQLPRLAAEVVHSADMLSRNLGFLEPQSQAAAALVLTVP
jgi:IclR family transcriptional regulator, KDG regulon repressor